MRPIVILWVSVIGLGCLGIVAFVATPFRKELRPSPPPESFASDQSPERAPRNALPEAAHQERPESLPLGSATPSPIVAGIGSNQVDREQSTTSISVAQRKAEFSELAMREDQESLHTLLAAMRDSSRAIRKAALEAVVQFDDRSAIPFLQELAGQTKDAAERNEILAALDYIKLPSLHEYLAERRKSRSAVATIKKSD